MNVVTLIYLLVFSLLVEPASEVEALYYQGSYNKTIQAALRIIEENPTLEPETAIELRKYIAFSYVALGMIPQAKEEFRTILLLDSTLTLDPQLVSPKIIKVFEETRKEIEPSGELPRSLASVGNEGTQSSLAPLSYRTAMLRSFAFPGWGQFYSGQETKGWMFALGEGLSLGGLIVSHIFTKKSHQAYLEATDPEDIQTKYKIYNNWYRTRNAFGGLAVGIWISAPLDMLLFPPSWARRH
jgi:hypothetical protein